MKHSYSPSTNLWTRPDFNGIAYSDGSEVEAYLLDAMKSVGDRSVYSSELAGYIRDWPSEYHLTTNRHCLLRPIPFTAGESVLELGCGCGAITRHLGELGLQVTAVEGGAKRAEITAERVRDLQNVKVVFDDLVQFKSKEKFDWVTLIGVLEYSPMFAPGEDPVDAYLQQALTYLKPGGQLIVAIENQIGLKYFNGCGEDHVGHPFFGPQGLYQKGGPVTFGKKQLQQRLVDAGFVSVDFYYPYPDYKIPHAILSEQAFTNDNFRVADLILRMDPRDYGGRITRLFSEHLVAKTLEENGILADFSNSFLAIASTTEKADADSETTLAWSFSLSRKPGYRTETTFSQTTNGIVVDKHLIANEPSPEHSDLLHHVGVSDYATGSLQSWDIHKSRMRPYKEEELANAFLPYLKVLFSYSQVPPGANPDHLESWQTPGSLVDLTPFNIVETTSGPKPIDMEWEIPGLVPTGWIIYRSIIQTLASGITPSAAAQTTVGSLMERITGLQGIRYSDASFQLWGSFEETFIEAATGRKNIGRVSPGVSISKLSPLLLTNIDHPHGGSESYTNLDHSYQVWLAQRGFISTDTKFLQSQHAENRINTPRFQIIIQLKTGFESLLADTLDSLGQQIYDTWRLDVVSTQPSPAGIEDIPNVNWETVSSNEEFKPLLDILVKTSSCDWVIEAPPGTRFDILYLWRLAYEIQKSPETNLFFVDDDCCDNAGHRYNPRFKPGVNIEALRSSDLAGPLCTRTSTWLSSGGASQHTGSPWFEKLLQITDKSGWSQTKHIPDILISFPYQYPTDTESCHRALSNSLKSKGIQGEIRSITPQSWNIRHSLENPPQVTIAILSTGQLELINRCLTGALQSTSYPCYEILIVTNKFDKDPDFDRWLLDIQTRSESPKIRVTYVSSDSNYATRCNAAIACAESELVVLAREETVFVQEIWLEELVGALAQTDIAAATPLIHKAGDAKILAAGLTLGLLGEFASPHAEKASLGEAGYLDCLQMSKDTVALPSACFLIRKSIYQTMNGMDETELGNHFAEIDLCLKLHQNQHRVVVHPKASVVFGLESSLFDLNQRDADAVKRNEARETLHQRWGSRSVVDPYWNTNLSLCEAIPQPETQFRALWQFLPTDKPRILAHAVANGQGDYRITDPLRALRKAGLASECVRRREDEGISKYFSAAEICRLNPTTVIVQNYIHDISLATLNKWSNIKDRPFIIYTLDDLINDLDKTNPFRKNIPPNARSRFKYALSKCDRLVLSTEFLADTYRHFIDDIKVVPNRLQKDVWVPLKSKKRTSLKPRVGWAGGSTHEGDLILLKEIIEQTRDEVDWVFFGMCPEEIRPLLAEFHDLVPIEQYPAYLASLNLDIAVAPLATTPFNQGKSNLRLLEYGALGIPVVCTDIDPYQNSPACRVKNTTNAWVAALRERIYDADAREIEGNAMREWLYQSYILEEHLDDWLNAHLPS
jgi:glycosyltransferase involved in cell wall biosynthesis/GT2 family glycosyltransferase/SAM-dependent methyltransferase